VYACVCRCEDSMDLGHGRDLDKRMQDVTGQHNISTVWAFMWSSEYIIVHF
jgi:hypothetical protein